MQGRFREASQKWGRGGARGRAVRAARTREAKGHRPGPTTRALPSMAGRGQGERGESLALGGGRPLCLAAGSTVPTAKNRRGGAPRGVRAFAKARAASPRRDAATKRCAARRSAPLALFAEG